MIQFELKGLKEIENELRALPAKMEKNVMTAATRQAANVYRDEARAKAPVSQQGQKYGKYQHRPGHLRKQIRSFKRRGQKGEIHFQVGPTKRAFYARFVELGHATRLKEGGNGTSHVPANPFMRPAFDGAGDKAVEAAERVAREKLATQGKL